MKIILVTSSSVQSSSNKLDVIYTGNGSGGINAPPLTSGAGGRGERLNPVQKERMKLLTSAAFDRGKEEDTFGMDDEDWQLYKRMSKDADDVDEDDDQEAELAWLTNRLKVYHSTNPCSK